MGKFYNLLQEIKEKPVLYLGEPSIKLLNIFIAGYSFGEQDVGVTEDIDSFKGLNEYIAKKYRLENFSHDWSRIIFFCSSNDRDAFYQFYEDFEEFLKLSKEEKQKIVDESPFNQI